jgi:polyketide cyclase/dehydrase/lipid transport protein
VRDAPLPRHSYALVTEWVLATGVDRVWDALVEPQSWPAWWRYVQDVVLLTPGDADGIAAVRRYTWTSRLPYRLTFDMTTTRIELRRAIEGVAAGELQGTGRWELHPDERGVHVRYAWAVTTRKRWMNALAPLLAPVFAWNHDQVMAEGARGLARHLGVPLVGHRRID